MYIIYPHNLIQTTQGAANQKAATGNRIKKQCISVFEHRKGQATKQFKNDSKKVSAASLRALRVRGRGDVIWKRNVRGTVAYQDGGWVNEGRWGQFFELILLSYWPLLNWNWFWLKSVWSIGWCSERFYWILKSIGIKMEELLSKTKFFQTSDS